MDSEARIAAIKDSINRYYGYNICDNSFIQFTTVNDRITIYFYNKSCFIKEHYPGSGIQMRNICNHLNTLLGREASVVLPKYMLGRIYDKDSVYTTSRS